MSVHEAKARLLSLDAEPEGRSPMASFAVPAAGAALLLGIMISRRRRRGLGLMSLGALAANPALRGAFIGLARTAAQRMLASAAR